MKCKKQSFVESDMLSPEAEAKRIKDARAADELSCEATRMKEVT